MHRRRNANECFGACNKDDNPWQLSGGDIKWYTDWLAVRGVNLFIPHAFYYSICGKRKDERPPDVGPHSIWWAHYNAWSHLLAAAVLADDRHRPACGGRRALLQPRPLPRHRAPAVLSGRSAFSIFPKAISLPARSRTARFGYTGTATPPCWGTRRCSRTLRIRRSRRSSRTAAATRRSPCCAAPLLIRKGAPAGCWSTRATPHQDPTDPAGGCSALPVDLWSGQPCACRRAYRQGGLPAAGAARARQPAAVHLHCAGKRGPSLPPTYLSLAAPSLYPCGRGRGPSHQDLYRATLQITATELQTATPLLTLPGQEMAD